MPHIRAIGDSAAALNEFNTRPCFARYLTYFHSPRWQRIMGDHTSNQLCAKIRHFEDLRSLSRRYFCGDVLGSVSGVASSCRAAVRLPARPEALREETHVRRVTTGLCPLGGILCHGEAQTLIDLRTQSKSCRFPSAAGSTKPMQTGARMPLSSCAVEDSSSSHRRRRRGRRICLQSG